MQKPFKKDFFFHKKYTFSCQAKYEFEAVSLVFCFFCVLCYTYHRNTSVNTLYLSRGGASGKTSQQVVQHICT